MLLEHHWFLVGWTFSSVPLALAIGMGLIIPPLESLRAEVKLLTLESMVDISLRIVLESLFGMVKAVVANTK
jgi:hypothetical protein